MGMVAVTMKVMPDQNVDTERIKKDIMKIPNVKQIKEIPIAFGLKMIEVLFVMNDQGGVDKLEEKLSEIEGVISVEAGDVTLV